MSTTIIAREVKKSFSIGRGSKRRVADVLRGVSLRVESGEMVGIVGPSGSGKSTLLYCLSGLEAADSGSIQMMGTQMVHAGRNALSRTRRDHVGFIFQSYNLIPSLSVGENVSLPARLAGRPIAKAQTSAVLKSVGLDGKGKSRPGDLSGGEQQRVAIARALAGGADVIFADEPTGRIGFPERSRGAEHAAAHRRRPETFGGDGDARFGSSVHGGSHPGAAGRAGCTRDGALDARSDPCSAGRRGGAGMMRLVFSDLRDHAATWIGAFLVAVGCGYIGGWAVSILTTTETYRNLETLVWTMVAFSSFAAAVVLVSAANLTVSAQRRSYALWQIANVGPRSVGAVVLAQLAVVATLGAACGTLVETITYAPLFPWVFSSPFYQPIDQVVLEVGVSKMPAVWLAVAAVSLVGGLRAARSAGKTPPLEALRDSQPERKGMTWLRAILFAGLATGTCALFASWLKRSRTPH